MDFFVINLMSLPSAIPEQDSLLQKSHMQLFLNHSKRSSVQITFRKPGLSSDSTQPIPPSSQKKHNTQAGFSLSKRLSMKSPSLTALSTGRHTSRTVQANAASKPKPSNMSQRIHGIGRVVQQNENVQAALHKINFRSVIVKTSGFKVPLGMAKRESLTSLGPKIKVQSIRKINKKYERNSPFDPDYLQSDYLQ